MLALGQSVTMLDEQAELGSESLVQQLDEIFSHGATSDLGEAAQIKDDDATEMVKAPPLKMGSYRKHISFQFKKDQSNSDLGESRKMDGSEDRAKRMIHFGQLLQSMNGGEHSERNQAVSALNEALHAKLLMDELKPSAGSFAKSSHHSETDLGEDHDEKVPSTSFTKLIHEHKKNMAEITQFLLERKKMGHPLSSHEDNELQKFYYNRASTILKKIVLLKHGEEPPPEKDDDDDEPKSEKMVGLDTEKDLAQEQSDAEIERLRFDAKVANANAAFNNKMLSAKKARMQAVLGDRQKAYNTAAKAAQDKSKYDKKVSDAETKYNKAVSDELLKEKHLAEIKVQGAAEQKQQADIAAEKATREANEADKEAAQAEKEAKEAQRKAKKLEEEAMASGKTVPPTNGSSDAQSKRFRIPLSVTPHCSSKAMLRYLQTTIDKHLRISVPEQQLMQSYFLKHGSALLSQLAQIDPDATWHSPGVMHEEQYEIDRNKPDTLSQEWGSKHLKADTVMHDFIGDALQGHTLKTKLLRPHGIQAVNLFGNAQKIPLRFAPDTSQPIVSEPTMHSSDLGESDEDEDQTPHRGALSAMMGIMDEDETSE
jgi:hypothetical protein